MSELIEIIIIPAILLYIGYLATKKYFVYEKHKKSKAKALIINIIWWMINVQFLYYAMFNFENNFNFKVFICFLNIVAAILMCFLLFDQKIFESLKIMSIVQIGLLVLWSFLTTIGDIIDISVSMGSIDLEDYRLGFFGVFLLLFGLSMFLVYSGDKMQFIKFKETFAFSSISPAVFYFMLMFIDEPFSDLTLEIVILPAILFFVGFLTTKIYLQYKKWKNSSINALLINIVWLFLIMVFMYIVLLNFENYFYFKIIISIVNLVGAILISRYLFKQELFESFKILSIVQIGLLVLWSFLSTIQDIINIYMMVGSADLDDCKLGFFGAFLFLFGLSIFLAYWGDKMQLIKFRRTFVFFIVSPALYYLIMVFINEPLDFITYLIAYILTSIVILVVSNILFKRIAYTTIEYGRLRELTIHEKGKMLLDVRDLHVHYPLFKGTLKRQVGAIKAVNGVSFSIKTGETLGLVGESGCGKTTIAKTILGLIEKTKGEILFNGAPVPAEYSSYLRQKIQMVFQDPDASLNSRLKVVDIIGEPIKNLMGITDKTEIRKYVLKLLDKVSLKREHMDRYPHEFSGGQKQRIVIARALACNPDLIILDEPTSALDVSVQAQILNLLKDLQAEFGYGFLFITHNLAVVNHIADRVAVMYLGNIVEVGSIDQIFNNLTHPYTIALLTSRSEIDPNSQEIKFVIKGEVPSPLNPPSGCTFNPRCSSDARTEECEVEMPHKIKIEDGHYIWCVNDPPSLKKKS